MKFIRLIRNFALACVILFALFVALDFLYPLNTAGLQRPQALLLRSSENEILNMQIASDGIWRLHAHADEIPDRLKRSVVHFEDRYFYYHFGVNPASIVRAFVYNISQNFTHNNTNIDRVGASTITMQVARMMNPKARSYKNKIIEIFNAFQLEFHYSKDEILTMYFNLAPYGGNIEGVKTASFFYFSKSLGELSNAQIAMLSIVPKNPNKNRLDKKNKNANALKNRLIKNLFEAEILSKSEYERAKAESFIPHRFSAPSIAPHYAMRAFKVTRAKGVQGEISSNLNKTYQLTLENFLSAQVNAQNSAGVNNGSALLIDNDKMAVVAYVGSHDFAGALGQNDGVSSAKNVGSTLKPFIYARALERGLITPSRTLIDAPITFEHYVPRNYNQGFLGEISASSALELSLNIPAVKLALGLGDDGLYELLERASLTQYAKNYYGLGIALGGISLSLIDLAHLYTVFVNDGELRPLEIAGAKIDKNATLLRPQSAYIVTQMLKNAPRSYLDSAWQNTQSIPPIMFKTGTSADARDLYTVALTPKFTLGVWLGNFSGAKSNDLSGGMSAARVAFDMFAFLGQSRALESVEFARPQGVSVCEVCVDAYREDECKKRANDLVIDDVSLNEECEIYNTSELYFLLKNKIIDKERVRNGRCRHKFGTIKPSFNDINNKIYETNDDEILRLNVQCTAVFGDDVFISANNKNYEKHENNENFIMKFRAGEYELKCLDENANFTSVKFRVNPRK